jgi:exopolyphosphatase/guanosine-5'-triphosphate,3'-diphosphate pyrophosphatase
MRRTADAVISFIKDRPCDRLIAVGTEALRLALNSGVFESMLGGAGVRLHIISGQKEAELAFFGALYNLPVDSREIMLADVGGGSTELVYAREGKIVKSMSVPVGALKLLETLPSDTKDSFGYFSGRGIDHLMGPLTEIHLSGDFELVSTGGTITCVAAIVQGLKSYDAAKIHGMDLSYEQMADLARKFAGADHEFRRKLIPFDPERAELILPGLGIYLALLSIIERNSLVVSTGGLRFGAALHPDRIID